MKNIRIFIADDHAIVRTGLAALLDTEPGLEVVGEAADGAEADDCDIFHMCSTHRFYFVHDTTDDRKNQETVPVIRD